MVKRNILVNACGAKEGGAKTIIESFLSNIPKDNNFYYVFVGFNLDFEIQNENVKIIKFPTSGFFSLFFSIIGFYYFCLKYKANMVVSFMNLNLIFLKLNKITYIHQNKIFTCPSIRMKLYRLFTRINSKDKFICQTESVKESLNRKLNISKNNITTVWPSIFFPKNKKEDSFLDKYFQDDFTYCICPIIDVNAPHKNFGFLLKNSDYLTKNKIKVFVTSDIPHNELYKVENFIFVGKLHTEDLHYLYEKCEYMLFPSLNETVGLPIFECLHYKCKPVLYDAPYIKTIFSSGIPKNVILLSENNFDFLNNNNLFNSSDLSFEEKNEWNKLFEMIENYR